MPKAHIEVPDELKDFFTIENCEDFPIDRYLLTPNQRQIAEDILKVKKITGEMRALNLDYLNSTLLYGVPGTGKAQPLYSKVLTPDGFIEIGTLKAGDRVMTPEGRSALVDGIFPQGVREIYEVLFDDGGSCRCSDEHLWEVKEKTEDGGSNHKRYRSCLTLKKIREGMEHGKVYSVRIGKPPDFLSKDIEIPGTDKEFDTLIGDSDWDDNLPFFNGSIDQRQRAFNVLTVNKDTSVRFSNTDYPKHMTYREHKNAKFLVHLARSLGIKAAIETSGDIYDVKFSFWDKERRIVNIRPVGESECVCIYVDDPMHLYITDDYIVTHNTTFGRYLAYKFKMDFAFLNFANIVSGGVMGDTARNISKIFDFMKDQTCIFMMDEIDCIAVDRSAEAAATGGELSRITITVMQELDKYKHQKVESIILAATNNIKKVDPALRSRFAIKKEIVAWNNEQKEVYATRFLDAIKIPYNREEIHRYCAQHSTLQQREIEADMIRCIADWISGGKKKFTLNHIREK